MSPIKKENSDGPDFLFEHTGRYDRIVAATIEALTQYLQEFYPNFWSSRNAQLISGHFQPRQGTLYEFPKGNIKFLSTPSSLTDSLKDLRIKSFHPAQYEILTNDTTINPNLLNTLKQRLNQF